MSLPDKVAIVDVGPRDGFQTEQAFIPTELKIRVIDAISLSGIRTIETTSFVSPKAVPQMADAQKIMRGIKRAPGVDYTVLVPNTRGAELALEEDVDALRLVVCASETFNQRNVRMSVAESVRDCEAIVAIASKRGVPVEVAIGVSKRNALGSRVAAAPPRVTVSASSARRCRRRSGQAPCASQPRYGSRLSYRVSAMFTKALDIDGPVGRLEAVRMTPATKKFVAAAVICHVHPLHGEVMHHKLVKDRRFQAAPSSCPRNFLPLVSLLSYTRNTLLDAG